MATTVIWRSSGLKYHQIRCCGSTRSRRTDLTNEFRRRLTRWPSRRRPDRMIPPRRIGERELAGGPAEYRTSAPNQRLTRDTARPERHRRRVGLALTPRVASDHSVSRRVSGSKQKGRRPRRRTNTGR